LRTNSKVLSGLVFLHAALLTTQVIFGGRAALVITILWHTFDRIYSVDLSKKQDQCNACHCKWPLDLHALPNPNHLIIFNWASVKKS